MAQSILSVSQIKGNLGNWTQLLRKPVDDSLTHPDTEDAVFPCLLPIGWVGALSSSTRFCFLMPYDDEDDLFSEDFDFVDEDEDEVVAEEESGEDQDDEGNAPSKSKQKSGSRGGKRGKKPRGEASAEETQAEKSTDDSEEAAAKPEEPPAPPADHVVHVYEFGSFKRTINREFTSEDATAFAAEFNRTSAAHARQAVAASRDEEPAPAL